MPGSGKSLRVGNGNYSSILARKIPWMVETGGLQPTGLQSHIWLSMHSHTTVLSNVEIIGDLGVNKFEGVKTQWTVGK